MYLDSNQTALKSEKIHVNRLVIGSLWLIFGGEKTGWPSAVLRFYLLRGWHSAQSRHKYNNSSTKPSFFPAPKQKSWVVTNENWTDFLWANGEWNIIVSETLYSLSLWTSLNSYHYHKTITLTPGWIIGQDVQQWIIVIDYSSLYSDMISNNFVSLEKNWRSLQLVDWDSFAH